MKETKLFTRRRGKKLLSLVLAFAMVVTLLPMSSMTAKADETATPTPLTFTGVDDEDSRMSFSFVNGTDVQVKASSTTVSIDGANVTSTDWISYSSGKEIILPKGESVSFRGTNVTTNSYNHFAMFLGKIAANGDVTSLTNGVGGDVELTTKECYSYMFSGCAGLTSAPTLPSTTLSEACYEGMFSFCTELTSAPALPATTLTRRCYSSMFSCCSKLTSAPVLPATSMVEGCYEGMFSDCMSLTSAPELPATTLATYCYAQMFSNCSGLTSAPALPVTTLKEYCYGGMFQECTSLKSAPALPATSMVEGCYQNMFSHCTSLTSVPALPATSLANFCYSNMFNECTSLKVTETTSSSDATWKFPSAEAEGWNSNMLYNDYALNASGEAIETVEAGKMYKVEYLAPLKVKANDKDFTYTIAVDGSYTSGDATDEAETSCFVLTNDSGSAITVSPYMSEIPTGVTFNYTLNNIKQEILNLSGGNVNSGDKLKIEYDATNHKIILTALKAPTSDMFTFTAPESKEAATAGSATVEKNSELIGDITAVYYSETGKNEWSTTAPTKSGTYDVAIDVAEGSVIDGAQNAKYSAATKLTSKDWTYTLYDYVCALNTSTSAEDALYNILNTAESNAVSGDAIKFVAKDGGTLPDIKIELSDFASYYDSENAVLTIPKGYRPSFSAIGDARGNVSQIDVSFVQVYTITYELNGGKSASADAVLNAKALPEDLPTASKDAFIFDGWYTDKDLTTAAVAGSKIYKDTTLYAKWSRDLTAEKAAVSALKDTKKTEAEALIASGDSEAIKKLVTDAQKAIDELAFDENKTLDENKSAVTAIVTKLGEDIAAARSVVSKIEEIGTVAYTSDSKAKIDAARKAYDALTDDQKAGITSDELKVLTDAEAKYAELKAAAEKAANEAAAKSVVSKIEEIGTVAYTSDSKAKIDAARKAYNALTADQKAFVTADQLKVLTDAESKYTTLKTAAEKAAAEKAAAEKAAAAAKKAAAEAEKAAALAAQVSMNKKLKVTQSGNKLVLTWGKAKGAAGYKIYASYQGEAYKVIKTVKSTKLTINVKKLNDEKLDLTKIFRFRVAAYKVVNGKQKNIGKSLVVRLVGNKNKTYTNAKKIKLTTKTVTLSAGKTAKIKATTVLEDTTKKQLSNKYSREFRYLSTNKKVAKVNKKGKITAVAKGTCYVYVYSRNGLAKKVTVTVK